MAAAAPFNLLRSLRHRNYRLFFAGQSVSLIGTWITLLATSWLVYRLTGSAFLLGLVGFCSQIPMLFLGPIAGVFVDRWDRRRVLVWTQALSAAQSGVLALLTLTGVITVWQVLLLQVTQGVIHAIDAPARHAFVVTMLDDPADLSNAIALNSTVVNGSRIVGPAIGGVLVAVVGEGWCFALDAVSYLAVIASLLAMRLRPRAPAEASEAVTHQLAVGFRYVRSFAPIRTALVLIAAVSVFGIPHSVLMPVMATDVLGGGSHMLGLLTSAFGVGALGGALYLASRNSVVGLGRAIGYATLVYGVSLVAFSLSRDRILSLVVLPIAGSGYMTAIAASNTFIQTLVPEDLRGRVMSFYTAAFLGTMPIGSLATGIIAERIGAPLTITLGALACIATGIWFLSRLRSLRAVVRPIYIERGILTP